MMQALKVLIVPLWLTVAIAIACIKRAAEEVPHPPMHYTYLNDLEVKANEYSHVDIDGNGSPDFTFHTMLVGDPILKRDKHQFLVGSKIETSLLNDNNDQSPKLNNGDQIDLRQERYNWFEISSLLLTEKVVSEEGSIKWQGLWKEANHNYLPVQIIKNGQRFLGWIEISFDLKNQKLILHKSAVCLESNKEIRAGY